MSRVEEEEGGSRIMMRMRLSIRKRRLTRLRAEGVSHADICRWLMEAMEPRVRRGEDSEMEDGGERGMVCFGGG